MDKFTRDDFRVAVGNNAIPKENMSKFMAQRAFTLNKESKIKDESLRKELAEAAAKSEAIALSSDENKDVVLDVTADAYVPVKEFQLNEINTGEVEELLGKDLEKIKEAKSVRLDLLFENQFDSKADEEDYAVKRLTVDMKIEESDSKVVKKGLRTMYKLLRTFGSDSSKFDKVATDVAKELGSRMVDVKDWMTNAAPNIEGHFSPIKIEEMLLKAATMAKVKDFEKAKEIAKATREELESLKTIKAGAVERVCKLFNESLYLREDVHRRYTIDCSDSKEGSARASVTSLDPKENEISYDGVEATANSIATQMMGDKVGYDETIKKVKLVIGDSSFNDDLSMKADPNEEVLLGRMGDSRYSFINKGVIAIHLNGENANSKYKGLIGVNLMQDVNTNEVMYYDSSKYDKNVHRIYTFLSASESSRKNCTVLFGCAVDAGKENSPEKNKEIIAEERCIRCGGEYKEELSKVSMEDMEKIGAKFCKRLSSFDSVRGLFIKKAFNLEESRVLIFRHAIQFDLDYLLSRLAKTGLSEEGIELVKETMDGMSVHSSTALYGKFADALNKKFKENGKKKSITDLNELLFAQFNLQMRINTVAGKTFSIGYTQDVIDAIVNFIVNDEVEPGVKRYVEGVDYDFYGKAGAPVALVTDKNVTKLMDRDRMSNAKSLDIVIMNITHDGKHTANTSMQMLSKLDRADAKLAATWLGRKNAINIIKAARKEINEDVEVKGVRSYDSYSDVQKKENATHATNALAVLRAINSQVNGIKKTVEKLSVKVAGFNNMIGRDILSIMFPDTFSQVLRTNSGIVEAFSMDAIRNREELFGGREMAGVGIKYPAQGYNEFLATRFISLVDVATRLICSKETKDEAVLHLKIFAQSGCGTTLLANVNIIANMLAGFDNDGDKIIFVTDHELVHLFNRKMAKIKSVKGADAVATLISTDPKHEVTKSSGNSSLKDEALDEDVKAFHGYENLAKFINAMLEQGYVGSSIGIVIDAVDAILNVVLNIIFDENGEMTAYGKKWQTRVLRTYESMNISEEEKEKRRKDDGSINPSYHDMERRVKELKVKTGFVNASGEVLEESVFLAQLATEKASEDIKDALENTGFFNLEEFKIFLADFDPQARKLGETIIDAAAATVVLSDFTPGKVKKLSKMIHDALKFDGIDKVVEDIIYDNRNSSIKTWNLGFRDLRNDDKDAVADVINLLKDGVLMNNANFSIDNMSIYQLMVAKYFEEGYNQMLSALAEGKDGRLIPCDVKDLVSDDMEKATVLTDAIFTSIEQEVKKELKNTVFNNLLFTINESCNNAYNVSKESVALMGLAIIDTIDNAMTEAYEGTGIAPRELNMSDYVAITIASIGARIKLSGYTEDKLQYYSGNKGTAEEGYSKCQVDAKLDAKRDWSNWKKASNRAMNIVYRIFGGLVGTFITDGNRNYGMNVSVKKDKNKGWVVEDSWEGILNVKIDPSNVRVSSTGEHYVRVNPTSKELVRPVGLGDLQLVALDRLVFGSSDEDIEILAGSSMAKSNYASGLKDPNKAQYMPEELAQVMLSEEDIEEIKEKVSGNTVKTEVNPLSSDLIGTWISTGFPQLSVSSNGGNTVKDDANGLRSPYEFEVRILNGKTLAPEEGLTIGNTCGVDIFGRIVLSVNNILLIER